MQRALWDVVTPGLRGVAVRLVGSDAIAARFLFDHEPSDDDVEDVLLAETSVIADFGPEVTVSFVAVDAPERDPRTLLPAEEWVYLRKEG